MPSRHHGIKGTIVKDAQKKSETNTTHLKGNSRSFAKVIFYYTTFKQFIFEVVNRSKLLLPNTFCSDHICVILLWL